MDQLEMMTMGCKCPRLVAPALVKATQLPQLQIPLPLLLLVGHLMDQMETVTVTWMGCRPLSLLAELGLAQEALIPQLQILHNHLLPR